MRGTMEDFTREVTSSKEPAALLGECAAEWTSQLAQHKYELTAHTDRELSFHKRYWPTWAIAVAVLLFPFGLVALFVRDDATITATFTPEGNGTRLLVTGKAPKEVAKAFAEMEA